MSPHPIYYFLLKPAQFGEPKTLRYNGGSCVSLFQVDFSVFLSMVPLLIVTLLTCLCVSSWLKLQRLNTTTLQTCEAETTIRIRMYVGCLPGRDLRVDVMPFTGHRRVRKLEVAVIATVGSSSDYRGELGQLLAVA